LTAEDLIAGVLRRTTRQGARHCDAERRQDERFHALLLVFLLSARLCARIADTAIRGPRVAPELGSAVMRGIRALGPHGGSSAVHQAGRTSGRFLGKPAMTERSRLSVSATISIGLRAMDERGIEPHVRVFDKSERTDGTYLRSDLCWSPFL
jgi:hypothetical protein